MHVCSLDRDAELICTLVPTLKAASKIHSGTSVQKAWHLNSYSRKSCTANSMENAGTKVAFRNVHGIILCDNKIDAMHTSLASPLHSPHMAMENFNRLGSHEPTLPFHIDSPISRKPPTPRFKHTVQAIAPAQTASLIADSQCSPSLPPTR